MIYYVVKNVWEIVWKWKEVMELFISLVVKIEKWNVEC